MAELDLSTSLIGKRIKKAVNRVVELNDVPKILASRRYSVPGGIRKLDRDRKMANDALEREFAALLTLMKVRSKTKARGVVRFKRAFGRATFTKKKVAARHPTRRAARSKPPSGSRRKR